MLIKEKNFYCAFVLLDTFTCVILIYDESNFIYLVMKMEKAMATHSSTLAWKIPWMEELGRLQSTGSLGVAED